MAVTETWPSQDSRDEKTWVLCFGKTGGADSAGCWGAQDVTHNMVSPPRSHILAHSMPRPEGEIRAKKLGAPRGLNREQKRTLKLRHRPWGATAEHQEIDAWETPSHPYQLRAGAGLPGARVSVRRDCCIRRPDRNEADYRGLERERRRTDEGGQPWKEI